MLGDHRALLETGFGLANPPASKALATCLCSVFDCSPWTTGALFFTVDDAKTWQVREAVYRAMLDAVDEGMLPVFVGADKAYMSAAHWDLRGYPLTRTAALREVEYLTSLVRYRSGTFEVAVKNWPRTADLRAYAEQKILGDPRIAAAGFVRQAWMDDFVKSQTREVRRLCAGPNHLAPPACLNALWARVLHIRIWARRPRDSSHAHGLWQRWRDFIIATGIKKIPVTLFGLEDLIKAGDLVATPVEAPIGDMFVPRQREIAAAAGLVAPAEKVKQADIVSRLRQHGIMRGTATLDQLRVKAMQRVPEVRRGVHRHLDKTYRAAGRDFRAAFFFPEDLQIDRDDQTVTIPLLSVWDHPHAVKNMRCSSAKAVKRAGAQPAAAVPGAAAPAAGAAAPAADDGGDDDVQEVDLFGEDETLDDGEDEEEDAPAGGSGSLALLVGRATAAVISQPGQTIMHEKTLDPNHDPQHVPTAEDMFSHAAADEMLRLGGHARAAAWVRAVASEYESYDRRGFSPVARWQARDRLDALIIDLHESLGWDPEGHNVG